MFNSLKYVKQLEGVGLSRNQAETHIEIMTEIIESNLATSQDLKDLRSEITQEFSNLRSEMTQLESRLTIKLGAIVSVSIGLAVTLSKLV